MYDMYIKKIVIDKVRHLQGITIPLSDIKKNLILTGKNGSGKTSLLLSLSAQLDYLSTQGDFAQIQQNINAYRSALEDFKDSKISKNQIAEVEEGLHNQIKHLESVKRGITIEFNIPLDEIKSHFNNGEFVLAYYGATRKLDTMIPQHIEKVALKSNYRINDNPRREFVKYILDLKMTEALAKTSGKKERADKIHEWFDNFENILKKIFEDDSIKLLFDEETFSFSIHQDNREPFDFNQLSDGYAAILDIVVDLMVRMQNSLKGSLSFDLPGIVLIDEIETHLHLELQKNVMSFLMGIFPNIQFIVSTHSPFVLSNTDRAVIFDLENRTLVEKGLTDLSYEGIVKGYFEVDDLSQQLRAKFERYKQLVNKNNISDDEMEEIAEIEFYLDEIPDYLALDITTEYRRLKTQFENRKDL